MDQAAGGVTREDVLLAYELILQRRPESDLAYQLHLAFPDRFALGRVLTSSNEFRARNPVPAEPRIEELRLYRGYRPEEVALLERFPPYTGPGRPGFTTNFLGALCSIEVSVALKPFDGCVEGLPAPIGSLQGETAEWIGTLKAVLSARDRWRILELGAGYGPWMVNTAFAARQRGITDIRLYGVEGDAGHVAFLHRNLVNNGLDPAAHVVLHGAVGAADGTATWGEVGNPAEVYGGRPLGSDGMDYHGQAHARQVSVPLFGIDGLLAREPEWDLVHIDIQGGEGEVCRAGMAMMSERVRWVVIGTHSRALDGEVMTAFHAAGWALENEKPTIMPWIQGGRTLEMMATVDGVQVWRNPRLAGPVV